MTSKQLAVKLEKLKAKIATRSAELSGLRQQAKDVKCQLADARAATAKGRAGCK